MIRSSFDDTLMAHAHTEHEVRKDFDDTVIAYAHE